jgi:hypothetical protein
MLDVGKVLKAGAIQKIDLYCKKPSYISYSFFFYSSQVSAVYHNHSVQLNQYIIKLSTSSKHSKNERRRRKKTAIFYN